MSATASRATVSSSSLSSRQPQIDGELALDFGDRLDDAAKPLAAFERAVQFDARLVADGAAEIGFAHQRPVDAGRRHLQPIGRVDRVFEVEMRRHRHAGGLAILDAHRAVGLLGHHLQHRLHGGGEPDAHQPIADGAQRRVDDFGDAPRRSVFDDQPRFVEPLGGLFERRDVLCFHRLGQ